MSVRLKIALTMLATGMVTALLVIVTVMLAFERLEHETTFQRASAFLARIGAEYSDLFERHRRDPPAFNMWLRYLVLYEPDAQLYLLDPQGTVLSSTGQTKLPPGFKVALAPVQMAASAAASRIRNSMPYVMGDDPERMDANAVIAAREVGAASGGDGAGYLYFVGHKTDLPESSWQALRRSIAWPALLAIAAIVAVTTLLAALVIGSVTRPLRALTQAVATLSQRSLDADQAGASQRLLPAPSKDEFGQLTAAFAMLLDALHRQWAALRRLDQFRREGVSNLSHDLRSPLTATAACLETLERRWAADGAVQAPPERDEDRRMVAIALRNTRNAAGLVRSLGDLARLDEPEFRLRIETVDTAELLDAIALRFAERAVRAGITLSTVEADAAHPPVARIDVELFERAMANLVDNALKFCPPGARITLAANASSDGGIEVCVADNGPGIAAADLPHLFDRFFRSRASVAPATGEGGKGLGLAIVKRIVELHGGEVEVESRPGEGTRVVLRLPKDGAERAERRPGKS
ncbi:MAG: HAMP domain-containing sensor histidine kinase [Burkholderiaceae bacterium]